MNRRRFTVVAAAALVAVAGLAGCGSGKGSGSATPGASGGAFPVTVTQSPGKVTLTKAPTRIVSLSPTGTEMLFAIGAGKQVKAVDDQSDYPSDAPRTKLSGFTPNAEAIAGYRPDLVVLSYDTNGLVAALAKLKIPVYRADAAKTLADSYREIGDLGKLTGHTGGAASTVRSMRDGIAKAAAGLPKRTRKLTYYYELDPQFHSATSATFIGEAFGTLGLTNIADAADHDKSGYPQLSAEYTVKANPDLIFLADSKCCGQSATTVPSRAGFAGLTAVRQHHIYPLDDDIASRWGPRVVQLVQVAAGAVRSVPAS